MNKIDANILALVQENNRVSCEFIALQVGLSTTAVQRRINKLRDNGTIMADVSIVSPERVNKPLRIIVDIVTQYDSKAGLENFRAAINSEACVQQAFFTTGRYDFTLILLVTDMPEYEAFTQRLLLDNDFIKRFETNVVMDTLKYSFNVCLDQHAATAS